MAVPQSREHKRSEAGVEEFDFFAGEIWSVDHGAKRD